MARLKQQSTHKHSQHVRAGPRPTSDGDESFGSPVHAMHQHLNDRVAPAPNIHSTPAARILYFVITPALLWATIIGAVRIL